MSLHTLDVDVTDSRARAAPGPRSAQAAATPLEAADRVERLYYEHRSLLLYLACRKFRVQECDAEALIQEVFLSYIQSASKIEDVRSWLVAAICNASRYYHRMQDRTRSVPSDYGAMTDACGEKVADRFAMQMTIRKVLRYMQPRCRETLYLHYFEGRSASDIAREFDTTKRYAEKLIHNCLHRAREIYESITAVPR